MTIEEADNILLKAVVGKYPTTYNGWDVIQMLLEVFNDKKELEAQIKAKDDEIETLKKEHGYEKCKKCTHYSCGTQPDSFGWEKCGWDYRDWETS